MIAAHGAEVCFCLGAGKAQVEDSARQQDYASRFAQTKQRLGSLPKPLRDQLVEALGGWNLRKRWREAPGSVDFNTIDEWLAHAASPAGNGASITRDIAADELSDIGAAIAQLLSEIVSDVAPVLSDVSDIGDTAEPKPSFEWLVAETHWTPDALQTVKTALMGTSPQIVLAGPLGAYPRAPGSTP